jgi:hypothetical protein
MSKKERSSFKEFLQQDGYLLIFTLVCGITLLSYFLANGAFSSNSSDTSVLGINSLRGVWVNGGDGIKCPEMRGLDVDGCITESYFREFKEVDYQNVSFNDEGRIVYSNDDFFVSGIFDIKDTLNNDVWRNVYIGDLNLKINSRQWVFESVVWNKAESPIFNIISIDTGYLLIFYPSITLTSNTRQFWVFEYVLEDDTVRNLSYVDFDVDRAFIESSNISVLEYEGDIYFRFDRLDPSLMGNREVRLYRFDGDLKLFRSFLLLAE